MGTMAAISAGPAHATDILTTSQLFDDEAIASTGAATTAVFSNAQSGGIESILFVATSVAGTADVKVEYVICVDPGCSVSGAAADFTDLISSSNTTCPVSEGLCRVLMPVVGAGNIKFTVTGVGSNNADTTIDLFVVYRENVR